MVLYSTFRFKTKKYTCSEPIKTSKRVPPVVGKAIEIEIKKTASSEETMDRERGRPGTSSLIVEKLESSKAFVRHHDFCVVVKTLMKRQTTSGGGTHRDT